MSDKSPCFFCLHPFSESVLQLWKSALCGVTKGAGTSLISLPGKGVCGGGDKDEK